HPRNVLGGVNRQVDLARQQRVIDLLDEARLVAGRAHAVAARGDLHQLGATEQIGDHAGLRERQRTRPRPYAECDCFLRASSSDLTSADFGASLAASEPSRAKSSRSAST